MLPIERDLPAIVKLVKENEVVWVTIPTGCGKSIGIPAALSEFRVFCTQPTIPAVISLYEYQKERIGEESVGWSAEGTRKFSKKSRIVYATAGYVRKLILSKIEKGVCHGLNFTDVLMVDEVHTGSRDNSIIIDLWVSLKAQGVKVPKLLLATATDSGLDEIKSRLGGVMFTSDFRRYAVESRYHNLDFRTPDADESFVAAAKIARELLYEKNSHGIVFCSGANECYDMIHLIKEEIKGYEDRPVEVVPCFSQCKREEILKAIRPADDDTIKIVCATNIAESSLTIPDVAWVVNMMTEKRITMVGGRPKLGPTWCSKNSNLQRKGRTGRTIHGCVCYFLCTEEFFSKLSDFAPLEIKNSPISDILIELLDVGLSPPQIITELSIDLLISGIQELEMTGCIVREPGNSYRVTHCGKFVSCLPMSVRNAACIWHYISSHDVVSENIFWPVVYFLLIDSYGPSLFWIPRKEKFEDKAAYKARVDEHKDTYFEKFCGEDPLHSLVNVMYYFFKKYHYKTPSFKYAKWSWKYSINNKKLKDICTLILRLEQILPAKGLNFSFDLDISSEELASVHQNVVMILKKIYADGVLRESRGKYVDASGCFVNVDTLKTCYQNTPSGSVLSLSEIVFQDKNGGAFVSSSLWVPI